jgi:hypothetical protein
MPGSSDGAEVRELLGWMLQERATPRRTLHDEEEPMSARMMLTHRRATSVRRLVPVNEALAERSAAPLVIRQAHAAFLVEATSLEAGQANRQKMVRARRARRLIRTATMPLILGVAIASGMAIGEMGQGTRPVRTIAPTRQPVDRPLSTASILPLVLIPSTPTTR